jgi:signal transduction histidine kinase
MRKAQLPLNEELRLAELEANGILDSDPEKEFDQLAELIKHITNCSYVTISFLGKDRQWFKSSIGIEMTETSRDISFCSHTILDKKIMVVPDSLEDERFADNPLVTDGPRIRFYAGAPIVSKGQNLGAVCAFDSVTRSLSPEQLRSLEIISLQVTRLLELRLKNKLILKKSAELLEMERSTVQFTIGEQEKERQAIGLELHENFAQIVAACIMHLNFAGDSNSTNGHFIQSAKRELNNMLSEMRKLSKSFNPLNFPYIDLRLIVQQSIEQVSRETGIPIKLVWTGEAENVSPNTSVNLFRIITQYMQLLSKRKDVKKVLLRINAGEKIELQIIDDGKETSVDGIHQSAAFNAIVTRIRLCEGMYDLQSVDNEGSLFIASLPADDIKQVA